MVDHRRLLTQIGEILDVLENRSERTAIAIMQADDCDCPRALADHVYLDHPNAFDDPNRPQAAQLILVSQYRRNILATLLPDGPELPDRKAAAVMRLVEQQPAYVIYTPVNPAEYWASVRKTVRSIQGQLEQRATARGKILVLAAWQSTSRQARYLWHIYLWLMLWRVPGVWLIGSVPRLQREHIFEWIEALPPRVTERYNTDVIKDELIGLVERAPSRTVSYDEARKVIRSPDLWKRASHTR